MDLKLSGSLIIGKLISFLTKTLGKGGGSAAPGLYALKVDPDLVEKLSRQIPQNIIITGTNGKTTTARLLNHFLATQNLKVVRNSTGSNLERGLASALINQANFLGQIRNIDIGIWEMDEAAFNKSVFQIKPELIVFLNAFRDQLDRYGEVDTVVKKWQQSLAKVSWQPTVIINGDDGHTLSLTDNSKIKPIIFQVHNQALKWEKAAGKINPSLPVYQAKIVKNRGLEGSDVIIDTGSSQLKVGLPIPGTYHVYDLLAAFAVYYQLNLPLKAALSSLNNFAPAFGRVEKINIKGTPSYIFLIKNPAGTSSVLETIAPELKKTDRLLLALNDNFADGMDVSWIWDADFERLSALGYSGQIICSGQRAQELAVRLKYSGIDPKLIVVNNDLQMALKQAKKGLKGRLFILPTYTALLALQTLLANLGVKQRYWEEKI